MVGTRVLVAGLGNAPYPLTRHSLGHYIVDGLAQRLGAGKLKPHPALKKDGGHLATAKHEGASLLLYKTNRPMNISGPPIAAAARALNVRHLVLVYDSVADLPYTLALNHGGGARGHNGVRSTQAHWPHGSFWHLRGGVGRPTDGTGLAEFVLSKLDAEERAFWGHQGKGIDLVLKALEVVLGDVDGREKSGSPQKFK
ncbi:peptidyl-tRNA hydrolase [Peniophora sp. CONT]|nr:peptidyl-tRNA hydrolase [Peniophora sp. CONT]